MSNWKVERRQPENVTTAQQYGLNTCTSTLAGSAVLETEAASFSKHW